jgi:hypothetical protein
MPAGRNGGDNNKLKAFVCLSVCLDIVARSPRTGAGYVAYNKPELRPHAVALGQGLAVDAALRDLPYGGWSEPVEGAALPTDAGQLVRNKLTKGQYENEVSWSMVDVDVAHAAGTAPFGGGVHSFGVGDRDRDAARWGWGRGALL